jgi:GNAT superfamily N-acetyltransferase
VAADGGLSVTEESYGSGRRANWVAATRDHEQVSVVVETDGAAVLRHLEAVVEADPVRHTVLATIRDETRESGADGWLATDGRAVAARAPLSVRPVALSEGWGDLFPLASALDELDSCVGIGGPVEAVDRLAGLLDRPVVDTVDERLFRCDAVDRPAGVPGSARLAGPADAADLDLLVSWRTPYLQDVFGRIPPHPDLRQWGEQLLAAGVYLWVDAEGEPVAQAAVRRPSSGVVRIGPVYTPPGHRGRGYASAVTAAATADVLARGCIPVLFTDLANPTSNRIYRRIGFRPVADRRAVWFE